MIHLAERASYRLLDLYRDGGKVEKMAAEYKRAASAFKDISDLASSQFALGTFYSVLYLGLGEGATYFLKFLVGISFYEICAVRVGQLLEKSN